jgi:hypothetical protein
METKVKNIYMIENDGGLSFSVQKGKVTTTGHFGKRECEDEVVFMVESVSCEDLTADGELVLCLTKDETKNLIKVLQELSN